ncbi:5-formyltetrahydrofolate cyclo-ligase family [Nesidiocoris tenuis]|nr:5-formyltetrahydrofolate cyclo-ligase family [Nesidiocoris tenuis]
MASKGSPRSPQTKTSAKEAEAPKTPSVGAGSKSLPAAPAPLTAKAAVSPAKAKETPQNASNGKPQGKSSENSPGFPANTKEAPAKDKAATDKGPVSPKKLVPSSDGKGDGPVIPTIIVQPPAPSHDANKAAGDEKNDISIAAAAEGKKHEKRKEGPAEAKTTIEETKTSAVEIQKTESEFPPVDLSSKTSIRMATWNRMECANLVIFPRPCFDRIPRFKGENQAVEQLAQLDVFKQAELIKVNLDKAHERIRLEVIQSGKTLVAGTPGLRDAVFLVVRPPMEPGRDSNRKAAGRLGISYYGMALEFGKQKIDLVVLGSVAVDLKGRRIGKGEGFSDLEYALLANRGSITPEVTIATLVHDAQVYDEFPESIFETFDVPVDIIITPSRIINVEKRLDRPTLNWEYLSKRRVDRIPIMQLILDQEKARGTQIELKADSDVEESRPARVPMRSPQLRYSHGQPGRRQRSTSQSGAPRRVDPRIRRYSRSRGNGGAMAPNQRGVAPPAKSRRPRRTTSTSVGSTKSEGQTQDENSRRIKHRRISRPRSVIDFSIKVSGLNNSVRIRDLKAALVERNVRPHDISWRATRGIALLHFSKRKQPQTPAPGTATLPRGMEDVITSLRDLHIKPETGPVVNLNVEVAQPIVNKGLPIGADSQQTSIGAGLQQMSIADSFAWLQNHHLPQQQQ